MPRIKNRFDKFICNRLVMEIIKNFSRFSRTEMNREGYESHNDPFVFYTKATSMKKFIKQRSSLDRIPGYRDNDAR